MALSQVFALDSSQPAASGGPIISLLISKDIEIQTLTSAQDKQLMAQCQAIREDSQKGTHRKRCRQSRPILGCLMLIYASHPRLFTPSSGIRLAFFNGRSPKRAYKQALVSKRLRTSIRR